LKRFDVIRFAQKACSNIAILNLVRKHGREWSDTVSAGEIHRALKAGYRLTAEKNIPKSSLYGRYL